jgi:hypothetical protein
MLIKYALADGSIRATWSTDLASLLEAQRDTTDTTHGYLRQDTDMDMALLAERFWVQEAQLVPKTQLTLTAVPSPFPADGATRCHVSVSPFLPCTLLVEGVAYTLTEADPVLELTADARHTFVVALAPMATAWADLLMVEAQDATP